jgi:hypothetical protein
LSVGLGQVKRLPIRAERQPIRKLKALAGNGADARWAKHRKITGGSRARLSGTAEDEIASWIKCQVIGRIEIAPVSRARDRPAPAGRAAKNANLIAPRVAKPHLTIAAKCKATGTPPNLIAIKGSISLKPGDAAIVEFDAPETPFGIKYWGLRKLQTFGKQSRRPAHFR